MWLIIEFKIYKAKIERIQRSKFHTIIEEFKSGQELKTIMYESTLKVKA